MIIQEIKVTRNYQITIPKRIVEEVKLKVGDKVLVIYDKGEIKIVPKNIDILNIVEKLKPKVGEKVDVDKILKEDKEFLKKIEKEYKK